MERKLLTALIAWRLKKFLRDAVRHNEELLKAFNIDAKEAGLLILDVVKEACDFLKSQAAE